MSSPHSSFLTFQESADSIHSSGKGPHEDLSNNRLKQTRVSKVQKKADVDKNSDGRNGESIPISNNSSNKNDDNNTPPLLDSKTLDAGKVPSKPSSIKKAETGNTVENRPSTGNLFPNRRDRSSYASRDSVLSASVISFPSPELVEHVSANDANFVGSAESRRLRDEVPRVEYIRPSFARQSSIQSTELYRSSTRSLQSRRSFSVVALNILFQHEQGLPVVEGVLHRVDKRISAKKIVILVVATVIFLFVAILLILFLVPSDSTVENPQTSTDRSTFFPSEAPSSPPSTTRDSQGIYAVVANAIGRTPEELTDLKSTDPAIQASLWIVNQDRRELLPDDPDLLTRFGLATLYFSTGGWNWTDCSANFHDPLDTCYHYDWYFGFNETGYRFLSEEHHCLWYGVECTESGSLKMIHLLSNNLYGTLPSELAILRTLQFVRIIDNFLTGSIPQELGSLHSIIDIELNNNLLSEGIPASLFENRRLQRLNLGNNALSGTIPTSIGHMTSVKGLFLFFNNIGGRIPKEIGNLEQLKYARWGGNSFTEGPLPSEFGQLQELTELHLNQAGFTGTIPEEFSNLQNLAFLAVNGNKLTGSIDVLYDMKKLSFFYGHENMMTGTINPRIQNLKDLRRLILRRNQFHGTIPDEIVQKPHNKSKLELLWLHYNNFTGTITDSLCALYNVNLKQVYADCLPNENDGGEPAVKCNCCTSCCLHDSTQEECKGLER